VKSAGKRRLRLCAPRQRDPHLAEILPRLLLRLSDTRPRDDGPVAIPRHQVTTQPSPTCTSTAARRDSWRSRSSFSLGPAGSRTAAEASEQMPGVPSGHPALTRGQRQMASQPLTLVPYLACRLSGGEGPVRQDRLPRLRQTTGHPDQWSRRRCRTRNLGRDRRTRNHRHGRRPDHNRSRQHRHRGPGGGRCPRRNPNQSQSPYRRLSRCRRRHSRRPGPSPDFPIPAEYPRMSPLLG